MSDQSTNGAAFQDEGEARKGLGKVLGGQKQQVEDAFDDAKGRSLDQFNKAMDAVDRLVEKAPADYRPKAREIASAARQKPLLTTLSVAGVGLFLAGLASRGLKRR